MEILLFIVLGAFAFYKYSKFKMKKALEQDSSYFFEYCREKGYNTLTEQQDLCKRLGLNSSVIFKDTNTHSTDAKAPITVQQTSSKFGDFDANLTVIWSGNTKPIEVTYAKSNGKKERRTISPKEVCYSDEGLLYIKGVCHQKNEPRTFRQDRMTTMIKVGSQRYDFLDWCEKFLGVDVQSECPTDLWIACP